MLREKVFALSSAVGAQGGEFIQDDLKAIEEFIGACLNYVQAVTRLEILKVTGRNYLEGEEYRETVQEMDKTRSIHHNSLIAALRLINRLCQSYGVEPIYKGGDNRIEIGTFAGELVREFFENRKL